MISRKGPDARAINAITDAVIGAAIEVHRALGPGLLESVYETALCRELGLRGMPFTRQVPLPVVYKGHELGIGYRIDILVNEAVVVEVKAVESILPIHEAQLLSYLRLGGWKAGLILNFHAPVLRSGIKRLVLGLRE